MDGRSVRMTYGPIGDVADGGTTASRFWASASMVKLSGLAQQLDSFVLMCVCTFVRFVFLYRRIFVRLHLLLEVFDR